MGISVKILADSLAPCGKRLTTFECTYPRAIHSEIMTHRALVKSSASSRAIPVEKLIQRVLDDPWVPTYIGQAQKGMQAGAELAEEARDLVARKWLYARDCAVGTARDMVVLGAPKQIVNRLLEPWMFITVIITGTDLNNFFALRRHEAAEPHFHELADKMYAVREASTPKVLRAGEWHMPLIDFELDGRAAAQQLTDVNFDDMNEQDREIVESRLVRISIGRCARVSYLTHDGRRDIMDDLALYDRLRTQNPPHAAPFEHVAMALDKPERHGCLTGWKSHRMMLPNESVPG